jgi:hypothetical protein
VMRFLEEYKWWSCDKHRRNAFLLCMS